MLTFEDHRGQFHKMNTALVALTALHVVGAAAALSAPYWASSVSILAPLAAFAATPLGIGILATVAVALIGLAWYAINRNNKISEEKAPKITKDGLVVRRDVYEEMKKDNQVKDDKGNAVSGKYCIDFKLGDNSYRVIVGDKITRELGNTLLLDIESLQVKGKDKDGKYVSPSNKLPEELGLNKDGAKEVNTCLCDVVTEQAASQTKKK